MAEGKFIDDAGREVDLTSCEREPIHIPGAIQPHGLLLALREPDLTIAVVSDNVQDFLGKEAKDLLGTGFEELLDETDGLHRALAEDDLERANPMRVRLAADEAPYDLALHRSQGLLLAELEPSRDRDAIELARRIRLAMADLQRTEGLQDLFEAAVRVVRDLTGFERVMVYRFDKEWNGQVVAEDKADHLTPYLGLRYPASDIPKQARALYSLNKVRLIADSAYQPAHLVPRGNPLTGEPLDLSLVGLRSVSPIHREYLGNMGVTSCMSIALNRREILWGIIALHDHRGPRYPSYELRRACELVGDSVALLISEREAMREYDALREKDSLRRELTGRMQQADDFLEALLTGSPDLRDVAGAEAVAVIWRGEVRGLGPLPPEERLRELAAAIAERDTGGLWASQSLPEDLPGFEDIQETACGVLAGAINRDRHEYVLWLRPERARVVSWGGNPEKPVRAKEGKSGLVLHPRTSFELWKQEVRGRAEPWSRAEEEAASRLRVNLVDEAITRANRELRLVNERLREKNAEMDSFAYVVSHDLKEPLRGLQFHSKTLLRDHGDKLDEKGIHKLERIKGLSERMTGLMDALLEYSRMGRTELRVQECDLNEVVENVLELLRTSVERKGFEVRIPEPLPCVSCDPVKIGEVYNNLISNALKYNDKAEKWIELGADESNGEAWLYVRDNGIGIEQEHHGDIFGMFKRLHGREEWGGGTGSGLAMVAKILERHDSSIKVESEPGEETTFYFNLPLCGG